ncbi:sensor domain-containing protein [Halalkalibacter alkalisediminis]|uniref:EAL domain-containing protein n=1 Tax=Halalkalibacter alkalisediminis TaxID=935616 RepID=A0ABV6NAM7_9BACI|nr:EAL domain-containing protein [Halalkalibacter alkalisediminis]
MGDFDIVRKLKKSEQQYESLFFHSSNAIFILNSAAEIKKVNPLATLVTGYKEEDLLMMKLGDLVHQNDAQTMDKCYEKALKGIASTIEMDMSHPSLNELTIKLFLVPIEIDNVVESVMAIVENMTDELKISKMAMEDDLTGLPNRRCLMEKLSSSLTYAFDHKEKLAVLFIDLDRFKLVNDALGHLLGDQALIKIASRLQNVLDELDLLARVGGDEFVILIPHLSSVEQATNTAKQLLEEIRDPLVIEGYEFTLTASIGISIYPDSGTDTESLMKSADAAMYRAKANGSDACELYKREMRYQLHEKFHVENDLRRALERGEFSLFFQPQFDLSTNQYCGEEVLVRWDHPVEGLISPSKFLSIAEESGLIVAIGEWVLKESCLQKKRLIEQGFPEVPMSVNLSLKQFLQKNIVETVKNALQESKLPPHLLELEVTESVTIDIDRTKGVLQRLLSLGVHISLDDFGTGYSSLQYVSQLSIQELKIDQTFVRNIGKERQSEGIISMIINLAHYLNITVIAEGVETEEQLLFLKEHRCNKVQGYYYSRPLALKEYKVFLTDTLHL